MSTDVNTYWTPGQWTGQNVAALVAVIAALGLSTVTRAHLMPVSILICCVVNGLLGLRRNRVLGAVGFVSGLGLILGTGLMIVLTWRWGRTRNA
jgi:hypothetical protein